MLMMLPMLRALGRPKSAEVYQSDKLVLTVATAADDSGLATRSIYFLVFNHGVAFDCLFLTFLMSFYVSD